MKYRVLVLGAGGFVGRRLVSALLASDWAEPTAARRNGASLPGIQTVAWDAADADALARICAGMDAVVNCVAGSTSAIVNTALSLSRMQATRAVPLRIVHFSSMAVYGGATGKVSEDSAVDNSQAKDSYAGAKLAAEASLADTPNVCVLRPGCIYGPESEQWSERIVNLLRAGRLGDLGERGDGYSNLVYIDDVLAAVLSALRQEESVGRVFNLAMRAAPSWNDYFIRLAREIGAVPVRRLPEWRLALESKVFAPPLKIVEILGAKVGLRNLPPVMSPALLRLWRQDIRLEVERAEAALGVSWTPLEQGLKRTAASMSTPVDRKRG